MLMRGMMSKSIPKKVIDVTGTELTPGKPAICLGNGVQGFECCCDECNYFLLCFPQFNPKNDTETIDFEKKIAEWRQAITGGEDIKRG
jgi:hypothetical protein